MFFVLTLFFFSSESAFPLVLSLLLSLHISLLTPFPHPFFRPEFPDYLHISVAAPSFLYNQVRCFLVCFAMLLRFFHNFAMVDCLHSVVFLSSCPLSNPYSAPYSGPYDGRSPRQCGSWRCPAGRPIPHSGGQVSASCSFPRGRSSLRSLSQSSRIR